MEDYEKMNKNKGSYYQMRVKTARQRIQKLIGDNPLPSQTKADIYFVAQIAIFIDNLERRIKELENENKRR
jgi:polyhydroxyalkanoate synthesis regulator phasin